MGHSRNVLQRKTCSLVASSHKILGNSYTVTWAIALYYPATFPLSKGNRSQPTKNY
ncbi:hypothetical protein [Moorena producens]|uniref:hypothetical protein n=1 Tax=Moorena producens TaxID=1155739 RepID=UPI0013141046|nr:hypothetical protein [Moorena producens]